MENRQEDHLLHNQHGTVPPAPADGYQNMSNPYGQPGYNPQYQNPPYGANAPPPAGWASQGQQQQFMPPPMPHPSMMMGGSGGAPNYAEEGQAGDKYHISFSDRSIRAAFIRKVFSMVTVMLLIVAVMTAIPFMNPQYKAYVKTSMGMYWAAYGIFFVVYLALMCCESVRRSFPSNLILTAIFTLAVGYMTTVITTHHSLDSVLLALIITTVCCGGIVVFASQTKYDLTNMMGIMFILSMCLMVFGLVAIISVIAFKVRIMYTIYAGLASILFMFYLAIDIQMLMGGKKYEISPEDHIFAAVQIFLDIIYIFWMLLSLIGGSKDN